LIEGRNVLLIDDVVTTGASLKAATKELRAAKAARIDALVFAKRL
jgi:predicted amidophosphoribosyltransferase